MSSSLEWNLCFPDARNIRECTPMIHHVALIHKWVKQQQHNELQPKATQWTATVVLLRFPQSNPEEWRGALCILYSKKDCLFARVKPSPPPPLTMAAKLIGWHWFWSMIVVYHTSHIWFPLLHRYLGRHLRTANPRNLVQCLWAHAEIVVNRRTAFILHICKHRRPLSGPPSNGSRLNTYST